MTSDAPVLMVVIAYYAEGGEKSQPRNFVEACRASEVGEGAPFLKKGCGGGRIDVEQLFRLNPVDALYNIQNKNDIRLSFRF